MSDPKLHHLEERAYRDSFSDGLIDLFLGLAFVWIGVCWLWIEQLAAFAAVIPAALIPVVLPLRARVIEPRVGYVRWTAPRRRWERDQLRALLALGVGFLVVAVGTFALLVTGGRLTIDATSIVAGLPATLLAIPVAFVAAAAGIRRLWAYAAILLAGAAMVVVADGNPGAPLLIAGIVVTVAGTTLFARFLRAYPAREPM